MRGMTDRPEAMLIRTPSFIPSHSFFLSPCLCTPPSLPLTIAGAARSLLHSVAFSLTLAHPSLACSLPLSLSSSCLSCFLPPSSLLQSSLPRSLFEPSGLRSVQCQERKSKGGGRKGKRVVWEIEAGWRSYRNMQAYRDEHTDRTRVKRWL